MSLVYVIINNMETLTQSEIFFFISSVSFVVLWVLVAILLFYLIRAVKIFYRIIDRVEGDISKVGDITREMLEEMKDSAVWGFISRRKRGKRKTKTGK
jgi:uncharacterized protein YqhQ